MENKMAEKNAPVGPIESGTNNGRTYWHNTETGEKGHSTTTKSSDGTVSHYTHQDGTPNGNSAPASGWKDNPSTGQSSRIGK
jgi:hypothetical protein